MIQTTASDRKLFNKTDLIIIIVLLVISFLFFIPQLKNSKDLYADIICDGKLFKTVNLSEDISEDISLKNSDVIIHREKGCIYFAHSHCKDKLCVKYGKLTKNSQSTACLPQRTVIVVYNDKSDNNVDVISY